MFFFFFSSYYTVGVHFEKGKHKIFGTFVRASGNVSTYREHSEVFMSDVLVMQCSVVRFLKLFVSPL